MHKPYATYSAYAIRTSYTSYAHHTQRLDCEQSESCIVCAKLLYACHQVVSHMCQAHRLLVVMDMSALSDEHVCVVCVRVSVCEGV